MPMPGVYAELDQNSKKYLEQILGTNEEILRAEMSRDRWWWRIIGIVVSLATVLSAIFEILSYIHS